MPSEATSEQMAKRTGLAALPKSSTTRCCSKSDMPPCSVSIWLSRSFKSSAKRFASQFSVSMRSVKITSRSSALLGRQRNGSPPVMAASRPWYLAKFAGAMSSSWVRNAHSVSVSFAIAVAVAWLTSPASSRSLRFRR